MKYSFPGQSALVTGAASGIGEATARLLAANGASVVVSDLQADAVQRVVDAIVADGGKAVANVCDVADAAQVEAAVACAVTHFGALHLAVNNAGIGGDSGPAGELSLEAWQRLIDVNLSGVAYGLRYQIPAILAAGGGMIKSFDHLELGMCGGVPWADLLPQAIERLGYDPHSRECAAARVLTHLACAGQVIAAARAMPSAPMAFKSK